MRILKILILWGATLALVLTIYTYGQVKYYWYANDQNWGHELRTQRGDSLDDDSGYEKGIRYKYTHYKFENNSEVRIILIILIFAGAGFLSFLIFKSKKKNNLPKKEEAQNKDENNAIQIWQKICITYFKA